MIPKTRGLSIQYCVVLKKRNPESPLNSLTFGILPDDLLVEAGVTNQKRKPIEILDSNIYRLSLRCHLPR